MDSIGNARFWQDKRYKITGDHITVATNFGIMLRTKYNGQNDIVNDTENDTENDTVIWMLRKNLLKCDDRVVSKKVVAP